MEAEKLKVVKRVLKLWHFSFWGRNKLIIHYDWLPEYLIWMGIGEAWLVCFSPSNWGASFYIWVFLFPTFKEIGTFRVVEIPRWLKGQLQEDRWEGRVQNSHRHKVIQGEKKRAVRPYSRKILCQRAMILFIFLFLHLQLPFLLLFILPVYSSLRVSMANNCGSCKCGSMGLIHAQKQCSQ